MADAEPSTSSPAPKGAKAKAAAEEPREARAPFKPAKFGTYERQVVDYVKTATSKNIWYYRDRMSTPRGPCSLPVLREAWVNGIIDESTLVWGQGLADWLPVRNVRTLVPQIRTVEVQVATWIKKTFALKPALEQVRKQRAATRTEKSSQVSSMY